MKSLRICILSREPNNYSTSHLVNAARERGHEVRVCDPLSFSLSISDDGPGLVAGGESYADYDAVIPRIGTSVTRYGTLVLRQFEWLGVYVLNTSHAIRFSRDKLRSLQTLARRGIAVPRTVFVQNREEVSRAIEQVGGSPVIVKLLSGTQGLGVILAGTDIVAQTIVETLHGVNQDVIIQEFIEESKGRDIRALVIGNRVEAAMRRSSGSEHEFRSNIHRGGSATRVDLPPDYEQAAVKAVEALGMGLGGVDILEARDGPRVLEVNSSPGLKAIEECTGLPLSSRIIEYIETQLTRHRRLAWGRRSTDV